MKKRPCILIAGLEFLMTGFGVGYVGGIGFQVYQASQEEHMNAKRA